MKHFKCPYCEEYIDSNSKICEFCGEDVINPVFKRLKIFTTGVLGITILCLGIYFVSKLITGEELFPNKVNKASAIDINFKPDDLREYRGSYGIH